MQCIPLAVKMYTFEKVSSDLFYAGSIVGSHSESGHLMSSDENVNRSSLCFSVFQDPTLAVCPPTPYG